MTDRELPPPELPAEEPPAVSEEPYHLPITYWTVAPDPEYVRQQQLARQQQTEHMRRPPPNKAESGPTAGGVLAVMACCYVLLAGIEAYGETHPYNSFSPPKVEWYDPFSYTAAPFANWYEQAKQNGAITR